MAKFKDRDGREWSIALDYLVVEKVESATGFNILDLFDPKVAKDLTGLKLLAILWAICESEAESRKMSRDDFKRAFDPDSVAEAGSQLEIELINFSPRRLQTALHSLREKTQALRAAVETQSMEMVQKMDPAKMAQQITEKMEKVLVADISGSAMKPPE
jgi:hypothetical protein